MRDNREARCKGEQCTVVDVTPRDAQFGQDRYIRRAPVAKAFDGVSLAGIEIVEMPSYMLLAVVEKACTALKASYDY
jgi:hypothetical protein